MKKLGIFCLSCICALVVCCLPFLPAQAGKAVQISQPILDTGELNNIDWNFADSNIINQDGKLTILAETSTSDTRIIAKNVSIQDTSINEMTSMNANMRITSLPKDKQFILAFGLSSIEAFAGQNGNIEMIFTNENGIKLTVIAYTEKGAETIVEKRNSGISLNKDFQIESKITPDSDYTLQINGQIVCNKKLPISGVGRFGVLQTGSCGAVFHELNYICSHYETPENTNIDENFDDGEFNINELYSTSKTNGLYPSGIKVEDYNGNTMLRFQNCGLSYIGTKLKYSNFEISFDMPYILRENLYDEKGVQIGRPASNIGVSFGSETVAPEGYTYVHDVDLITLRTDSVRSETRKYWSANLVEKGIVNLDGNEGYSFKLSVVDGHSICQVKKLNAETWVTVGECDYELQRSGYIYIWSTGNADCTIDNLKITNLDENPKTIETDYKSSVVKAEDYELTEEEKTLTFRDDVKEDEGLTQEHIFLLCCGAGAVLLITMGIVIHTLSKRKKEVKADA